MKPIQNKWYQNAIFPCASSELTKCAPFKKRICNSAICLRNFAQFHQEFRQENQYICYTPHKAPSNTAVAATGIKDDVGGTTATAGAIATSPDDQSASVGHTVPRLHELSEEATIEEAVLKVITRKEKEEISKKERSLSRNSFLCQMGSIYLKNEN